MLLVLNVFDSSGMQFIGAEHATITSCLKYTCFWVGVSHILNCSLSAPYISILSLINVNTTHMLEQMEHPVGLKGNIVIVATRNKKAKQESYFS